MRVVVSSEIRERVSRLKRRRATSGLLSVEESAALSSVGFQQCSEVIGAVAYAVTPIGFYASGLAPTAGWGASGSTVPRAYRTYTSSKTSAAVGTPATITAMKAGYRTALERLLEEASAVGADGVVGVRVTRSTTHTDTREIWNFLAMGTAIRSTGPNRVTKPFTTALSGGGTAAALRAGWVPISYLACPVMAIRGIDYTSSQQMRRSAPNGEVEAHTDAVNTCRHQARTDFAAAARAVRADAAVMDKMTVHFGRVSGPVEVTVVVTGTALAHFAGGDQLAPIGVLPLGGLSR